MDGNVVQFRKLDQVQSIVVLQIFAFTKSLNLASNYKTYMESKKKNVTFGWDKENFADLLTMKLRFFLW